MYSMGSTDWPGKKSGERQVSCQIVPILQVITFCGPEKESCIGNQTFGDESCLVSCTGLYADIVDDSLKQATQAFDQNVIKGRRLMRFTNWSTSIRFPHVDTSAGSPRDGGIIFKEERIQRAHWCSSTALSHLNQHGWRWSEDIDREIPQIQKGICQTSWLQPWRWKPQ